MLELTPEKIRDAEWEFETGNSREGSKIYFNGKNEDGWMEFTVGCSDECMLLWESATAMIDGHKVVLEDNQDRRLLYIDEQKIDVACDNELFESLRKHHGDLDYNNDTPDYRSAAEDFIYKCKNKVVMFIEKGTLYVCEPGNILAEGKELLAKDELVNALSNALENDDVYFS